MAATSSSIFEAMSPPKDSATTVYQHQIQNNPALTRALHQNESLLLDQGQKNDINPNLISTVVRHNSRAANIRPTSTRASGATANDPVATSIQGAAVWLGEAKAKLQRNGVADPTNEQILDQYANAHAKDPKADTPRVQWTYSWVKAGAPHVDLLKPDRDLRENDRYSFGLLEKPLSLSGDQDAARELAKNSHLNLDAGPVTFGQDRMQQVPVSDKAIDLLFKFEPKAGAGKNFDPTPEWPGEDSGVTIGIGYDIGQNSKADVLRDWAGRIPDADLKRLSATAGITGPAAKNLLSQMKGIKVPWSTALAVFHERTLPRYTKETLEAYPGAQDLPADSLGALVAMTINRGIAFQGDRNREKREIRDAIKLGNFSNVPGLMRKSKRVWQGTPDEKGLSRRREAEAVLFEHGLARQKQQHP